MCVTRMLPRCIACLGKDTLIGFIDHLYLDKCIFISIIYEICFDRIYRFYGKDLVCSRHRSDSFVTAARLFAMIIKIASMARILYVHVTGGITRSSAYFACFVGVSSSSGSAYSIY